MVLPNLGWGEADFLFTLPVTPEQVMELVMSNKRVDKEGSQGHSGVSHLAYRDVYFSRVSIKLDIQILKNIN